VAKDATTPAGSEAANDRLAPIPIRLKLGYGLGSLVDGVGTNAVNLFLLFYLTAICGMGGAAAGVALSAGLIVDAVFDPALGAVSDGWRSRWGRRLPFLAAGVIPAALSFVAIFTIPRMLHGAALFPAVLGLSILLRLSISTFNLPYQALGAEISDSYGERSSIAAWRWGLGMTGLLLCVALGFGVFFTAPQGLMHASAYSPFAIASTSIIIVGGGVSMLAVHALRNRAHVAAAGGLSFAHFGRDLKEVFGNPSFRVLFASATFFFAGFALNQAVTFHANTFFWALTPNEIQLATLATFAGLILGAPLMAPLVVKLEKRTTVFIGLFGLIATQVGPPGARLLGLLPLQHGSLTAVLSADAFVGGVMLSTAGIAFASMMADAADEHEVLFHKRREGLYFAGWAFAAKAAAGLGALFAGVALQLIGFPADLAAHGGLHATIPPAVIWRIGLVSGPVSGIFSLTGAAFVLAYRLDAKGHARVLQTLAERRAAARTIPMDSPLFP
jgi:GPH family glycoside/pentoside/hexuronide:cation symporter